MLNLSVENLSYLKKFCHFDVVQLGAVRLLPIYI